MDSAPGALVMVIEDDADLRAVLAAVLTDAGYQTHLLATGADAVAVIRQRAPQLVILDLWLEDADDGWWVVAALQRDAGLQAVPVIVSSGHAFMLTTLAEVRQPPHYVYLAKPYGLEELLGHVRRLIGRGVVTRA
jgi:two-component system, NtrC family, nitrogen regulation response regulator NtrX